MQLLFFILYARVIVRVQLTVELFKFYLCASARVPVKLKDQFGFFENNTIFYLHCIFIELNECIFLRKELCCAGAMTRRWPPAPTHYTLWCITASIMKYFIRNGYTVVI